MVPYIFAPLVQRCRNKNMSTGDVSSSGSMYNRAVSNASNHSELEIFADYKSFYPFQPHCYLVARSLNSNSEVFSCSFYFIGFLPSSLNDNHCDIHFSLLNF